MGLAAGRAPAATVPGAVLVRVAVAPLDDLRHPDDPDPLARFLGVAIAEGLLRSGQFAVMPLETAELWRARLGAEWEAAGPAQLGRMGVDYLVRGSLHRVLQVARVRLRLAAADPTHFAQEITWDLELDLDHDSPRRAVERALGLLLPTLRSPGRVVTAPPEGVEVPLPSLPEEWEGVRAYFALAAKPAGTEPERRERLAALVPPQQRPGLEARAQGETARLLLEQALLAVPDEEGRKPLLAAALKAIAEAARAEPWNSRWLALKGEIHYLLRQDYEARTDASVARLKNPLEGLAYVVLGLVAGLSTAEGNDAMKRALAVDPFLRVAALPPGRRPFQGGALESYFATWERLQARRQEWSSPEFERQVQLGETLFAAKRWEEAREAFEEAAGMEAADYRPPLYLARILIATGDPEEAVTQLRALSGENPDEWEVWNALGLALQAAKAYDDAEEAYRKALEERPDEPEPLLHLAESQILREQWEPARRTLRDYLARSPGNAQGWAFLGVCETHREDWSAAAEAFRRALALDPALDQARAGLEHATQRAP